MTVQAGSPIIASDVVDSSAGAGDVGKIPKLNASGELDESFTKDPIVTTYFNASSPATWTKSAGLKYIKVKVQAGGGSGAGGGAIDWQSGAGGGAGGYGEKLILAGSLGATETVTIGASDGNSSFGTHVTTTAGSAGAGNSTAPNSKAGGAGGTSSGGDLNASGESGDYNAFRTTNTSFGARGGNSRFGSGGQMQISQTDGNNATGYGAGGGGGVGFNSNPKGGGAGSPGKVIVEEYYN